MSDFKLPKGARWLVPWKDTLRIGDYCATLKGAEKVSYLVIGQLAALPETFYRIEKPKPRKPHRFDGMTLIEVAHHIGVRHADNARAQVYQLVREVRRRDKLKGKR